MKSQQLQPYWLTNNIFNDNCKLENNSINDDIYNELLTLIDTSKIMSKELLEYKIDNGYKSDYETVESDDEYIERELGLIDIECDIEILESIQEEEVTSDSNEEDDDYI